MLTGKTALITGGGSGIGRAAAQRLAEAGAEVWILGDREEPLRETAVLIGVRCRYLVCNVTDTAALIGCIESLDQLDVFVSNAGVSFPTPLADMSGWRQMMEVNFWAGVEGCLAAGRRMIRAGTAGRLVLVSSIHAGLAEPDSAAYGLAKAGLNQLSRQLAVEWAGHGILVNAVAPGFVETSMSCAGGTNECDSEWFRTHFVDQDRPRLPLRRPGRPEEIAEAVLFFANPQNSYCTGQVLTVDGGLTVRL